MRAAYDWFMRNKMGVGTICGFFSGMILTGISTGVMQDTHHLALIGFVLSYTSTALLGGGILKSDDYYRDKQGK